MRPVASRCSLTSKGWLSSTNISTIWPSNPWCEFDHGGLDEGVGGAGVVLAVAIHQTIRPSSLTMAMAAAMMDCPTRAALDT